MGMFAALVRWVLIRDPEGGFETQLLLCTQLDTAPQKVLSWFVMRWQLEVTYSGGAQASRIRDATSVVRDGDPKNHSGTVGFVLGDRFVCSSPDERGGGCFPAAWYHKRHPTFLDALALVRKELWADATFCGSFAQSETVRVPGAHVERLTDALPYAA